MREPRKEVAAGRGDWWSALGLVLLVAVFFGRVLFSREALLPSPLPDLTDKFLPMRTWTAQQLLGGTLPHWNPYVFCGMPFRTETAVYYPPNALFLFLPAARALAVSLAAHLALAGVSCFLLARLLGLRRFSAFAAGLVYAFCAQQVLRVYAGHVPITSSAAWIPLVFFFVERYLRRRRARDFAAGAIVFALQIFSDNTQIVFYTSAGVAVYALLRTILFSRERRTAGRALRGFAGVIGLLGLGAALAAVQVVPEVELAGHSVRSIGSYAFASSFSLPPENLLTFLAPSIMGDDIVTPYWGRNFPWEMIVYIGVLPLLAALFGMTRVRNRCCLIFTVLALLTLLVALGSYTPVYPILFRFLPGFNMLRGNCKLILLTAFFLALLAGFGLDEILFAEPGRGRRLFRNILIAAALAAAAGLAARSETALRFWRDTVLRSDAVQEGIQRPPPDPDNAGDVRETLGTAANSVIRFAGLLAAAALVFYGVRAGRIRPPTAAGLSLALILFDLWSFGFPYLIPTPPGKSGWPGEVIDFLRKDPEPSRVFTAEGVLPNPGLPHGIANIVGHHENRIRRYMEFLHFSQGMRNLEEMLPGRLPFDYLRFSPLFHLLNVKYVLLPPRIRVNPEAFPLELATERMRVYSNPGCLPRCYIVRQAAFVRDRNLLLSVLDSPHFNPRRAVILEDESAPWPGAGGPAGDDRAEITSCSANRVTVSAALDGEGYLVLADTFYPGWTASVDGEKKPVYRANYVQRAVHLEPGKHTVEFIYSPRSFKIGAGITLAALGIVMVLVRRPRGGKDPAAGGGPGRGQ